MATLITGSTGFVISNVVREFAERGHTVVALDVVAPNEMVERYLAPWAEQITWVQADILDPVALEQVASAHSITRIVHGAAITPGQEAIERAESRRTIDINLTGTANMLELAVRVGTQRLVYISSGAVYEGIDPPDGLLHEDLPLHPRRLYSVTKFASECLARRYSELYGFETASVRLGGPYGPMERVTGHRTNMSQLQQWTGKSLRGESIVMEPQGARDYTYVGDIAAGIRTILDAPALPHDVYNLASGVGVSLEELVAAFQTVFPDARFQEPDPGTVAAPAEPARRSLLDTSRIRDDLGFRPQYDLVSGLREYLRWRSDFGFTA